mmetsp:Transcript_67117/g.111602  ORF Transcript_67117/g.111602 Transcript_67117/m.111602 type:complete len:655 (+) Transcript_67117:98-2062(+)|eukprot:CAMPEP_0119322992 /NCGR_PEP_ID=MMETSP1333-20130426/59678_1 /TAXON_ID=418940 /ORGANISM="Scyphosphaera apsteinii, Strain RCC1455" /LENGTH=654 /DNA_ID=CAMNT_0007330343 /DNA_START=96 /DNA_END=2060 /DNA_ORIENTATION=+
MGALCCCTNPPEDPPEVLNSPPWNVEVSRLGSPNSVSAMMATKHVAASLADVYDFAGSIVLGKGGFGTVCTARKRQTGELFAVKSILLERTNECALRAEIEIQRKLDHPNICRLYDIFEDKSAGRLCLVMELCSGGSLVSRMQSHSLEWTEVDIAKIIRKVLDTLAYCHKHGIIHRDVKLDNFVYESAAERAELKLIDFGLARCVSCAKTGRAGTPAFMAPELWQDCPPLTPASDVWAIGVVAYMLLSGERPFNGRNMTELSSNICSAAVDLRAMDWVTKSARDFCVSLLQKDPRLRPSAASACKHSWIENACGTSTLRERAVFPKQKVVQSLQAFARADEAKKVALEMIACLTPAAKLEELRSQFRELDTDGSGTLSCREFVAAMCSTAGVSVAQLELLFDAMDTNGSGEVEYSEFIGAALGSRMALTKPSLISVFSVLDRDGDGYVTCEELQQVFGDAEFGKMAMQGLLCAAGEDKKLSFDEFKQMMLEGERSQLNEARHAALEAISRPVSSALAYYIGQTRHLQGQTTQLLQGTTEQTRSHRLPVSRLSRGLSSRLFARLLPRRHKPVLGSVEESQPSTALPRHGVNVKKSRKTDNRAKTQVSSRLCVQTLLAKMAHAPVNVAQILHTIPARAKMFKTPSNGHSFLMTLDA